jgi:hypothetical protein
MLEAKRAFLVHAGTSFVLLSKQIADAIGRDDVRPTLRTHGPNHTEEQLDAFLRIQDPGLRHPVVLVDRESPLRCFHGSSHDAILLPSVS